MLLFWDTLCYIFFANLIWTTDSLGHANLWGHRMMWSCRGKLFSFCSFLCLCHFMTNKNRFLITFSLCRWISWAACQGYEANRNMKISGAAAPGAIKHAKYALECIVPEFNTEYEKRNQQFKMVANKIALALSMSLK